MRERRKVDPLEVWRKPQLYHDSGIPPMGYSGRRRNCNKSAVCDEYRVSPRPVTHLCPVFDGNNRVFSTHQSLGVTLSRGPSIIRYSVTVAATQRRFSVRVAHSNSQACRVSASLTIKFRDVNIRGPGYRPKLITDVIESKFEI
jgi:hypothetical protein